MQALRQWINENTKVVTAVASALAVVLLVIMVASGGRPAPPPPAHVWYYDTVTKSIFTELASKVPPISSPAGNEAVQAQLFSCTECTETNRFAGYYIKYTPGAKQALEAQPPVASGESSGDSPNWSAFSKNYTAQVQQGRLYSADGITWHPATSPQGTAILQQVQSRCPGASPRSCPP